MSSCSCKLVKGVLLPFQVKPVKDRKDNPLHTLHSHETDHRPRPPPHFHEVAFNHIVVRSRRQSALKERQQLGEIPEQPRDQRRLGVPPPTHEGLGLRDGLRPTRCPIDGLGVRLHRGVIPPTSAAHQIAQFMHPAALMRHPGRDRLQGRR